MRSLLFLGQAPSLPKQALGAHYGGKLQTPPVLSHAQKASCASRGIVPVVIAPGSYIAKDLGR